MNRRNFIGGLLGIAGGMGLVRRRGEAAPTKPPCPHCKGAGEYQFDPPWAIPGTGWRLCVCRGGPPIGYAGLQGTLYTEVKALDDHVWTVGKRWRRTP